MIKEASEKDKSAIYNLWQSSFSIKNSETINCFFNYGMNDGKTILCEKDEKLVASVFMRDMNIMFHNRLLKSTFLSHVAVHPDYRKTSSLDECLKSVIDECEKKALFTFVEATSYKFWENCGFQEGTQHRYYELNERHFENVSQNDVFEDAQAFELKEAYDEFMKHFDGYKVRSLHDFEVMIKEANSMNERILIVRHRAKPMGYIRFSTEKKQVKVKEIIYLGSNAFLRLCRAALGLNDLIILELSEAEHIEKLFPLAIPRKRCAVMVRCNNFPLFNKLYNARVKTSKEAYLLTKKPRFMNEKY